MRTASPETCSTRADSRTSRMAPSRVTQQFACRKQPRQARRACAPQDPGNRNRTAENLLPAIAQKVEPAIGPRDKAVESGEIGENDNSGRTPRAPDQPWLP